MKAKLLFFAVAALMCAALAGCEPKMDTPTGSSTVDVGGGGGGETFDQSRLDTQTVELTSIPGLYATYFHLYLESSTNPDAWMIFDFTAFHDSPSFRPGTYAFPSTGAGTARGSFGNVETSGEMISGSVTISVSGEGYTITARDVVANEGLATRTLNFSYTGSAHFVDWGSGDDPQLQVEFGKSTIVDRVSGTPWSNMKMNTIYQGLTADGSMYCNTVELISEGAGTRFTVQFHIFSDDPELRPGTYSAPDYVAGTFGGYAFIRDIEELVRDYQVLGGRLTLSESGGVYTVQLDDVVFGDNMAQEEGSLIVLEGTYTGLSYDFYDWSDQEFKPRARFTGTSDFRIGDATLEYVTAAMYHHPDGYINANFGSFVLPASGYSFANNNRASFGFTFFDDTLVPGTYTYSNSGENSAFDGVFIGYPVMSADGSEVLSVQSVRLTAVTLDIRLTDGEWEVELSDTVTNEPSLLPSFDGVYRGRIDEFDQ